MKKVVLHTGEELTIREANISDAAAIIEFIKAVGDESDNLTFSSVDFKTTLEEEVVILQNHKDQDNQIFIIALIDDQIVGQLNVHGSTKPRLRHIGEFGISTRKQHWGKGIATAVLIYMLDWAKSNPVIKKINLKANLSNKKAIALYERFGFVHEGKHTRDFFIHGEFQSSVSMGLEIN